MGRFVSPFNIEGQPLLIDLLKHINPSVTWAAAGTPGFATAISAADKAKLTGDGTLSTANAMNQHADEVHVFTLDLGAAYKLSHLRFSNQILLDGAGSSSVVLSASTDNFSASDDDIIANASFAKDNTAESHIIQMGHQTAYRYWRFSVKADVATNRNVAWGKLALMGWIL